MSVCQDDFDRYLNRPPYLNDAPNLLNEMLFGAGYVFFDDYKLAVKTADEMTKQQMDKVRAYNEKFDTDFEIPVFNVTHDKK